MFRNIVKQHGRICVMVARQKDDLSHDFLGTGFLCHNKGYILTCAHTINLTDKLDVILPQPLNEFNQPKLQVGNTIGVSVAQFDSENDVALLKIKMNNSTSLFVPQSILGNENIAQVGATVCYLGFPFAQFGLHTLKISQSIISSKVKSISGTKQYQLDTMVHEGNSGGPLIELVTGKILGIISGRFSPTGNYANLTIGNHVLGTESTISYATSISYGIELLKSEGLNV